MLASVLEAADQAPSHEVFVEASMIRTGNIFAGVPAHSGQEQIAILAEAPGVRIERILSTGQASPPGFWYDQDWSEWAILLRGAAGLLIEGEAETRRLGPGDWVELPAHARHRVEWTDPDGPTVWLAFHWKAAPAFATPKPRARRQRRHLPSLQSSQSRS